MELLEHHVVEGNIDAMTVEVEGETRTFYFEAGADGSKRPEGEVPEE